MPTEWDRIEDDWHAYQGLAKEQWPRVDLTTLALTKGRRDSLIEAVERAYDVSRDQARREVGYWMTAAPRLRRERADVRRVPTGNRWSGQRRPTVDVQGDGNRQQGWAAMAGDYGSTALSGSAKQIRQHPVGAMLLALGLGMMVVQLARSGRD